MQPTVSSKCVVRVVRHEFTPDERQRIGSDLARAHGTLRHIENEFDQVKASYKARTSEAEANIDKWSTDIVNGFEMREKKCAVSFHPELRKKRFWLIDPNTDAIIKGADNWPIMVDECDMTNEDFQAELIDAESKFELRAEIQLFQQVGQDRGVLVIGRFEGRWFGALRIKIGGRKIEERLDSLQKNTKKRADAVKSGCKRAIEWLSENLGQDNAKGFEATIQQVIEDNKEREE